MLLTTQSHYGVLYSGLIYLRILTHYTVISIHTISNHISNHQQCFLYINSFIIFFIDNTFKCIHIENNGSHTLSNMWAPTLGSLFLLGRNRLPLFGILIIYIVVE